jgi:hypothetical protein
MGGKGEVIGQVNMIANKQLVGVRHGRRLMVDIRDIEKWIDLKKTKRG